MRILVNDHAGHPFQVQLSRSLAKNGHNVLHTYCALLQTSRGALNLKGSDSNTFNVKGVTLNKPFSRYSIFSRVLQEKALGKLLCQEIEFFEPDVVISANTPLGTQNILLNKCRRKNIKFIFWVQDLLGVGIKTNLTKKLPMLGKIAGRYYIRLEKTLLRKSHEVVVITEDFLPIMAKAGVRNENVHVIENWAPIEEVPVFSKSNQWSREKGLDDKFCFLYSGTLGMKHNPDLLVKLAISFKRTLDVRIIVISEGLGAKHLEGKKREHCLGNLQIVITVQKDWNEYVPAE